MSPDDALIAAPESIPGYRLTHMMRRGKRGAIYHAIQLSVQREVALKVVQADCENNVQLCKDILGAARAASSVHHPHVVGCFDAGSHGNLCWHAMELITGGDLATHLAGHDGPLDVQDCIGIALDCARGLEAVHRSGMTHRAINPSTIMLTSDGLAKIGDLAMAAAFYTSDQGKLTFDDQEIAYVAPELLNTDHTDIRGDIYALGASLYHACTGSAPFAAISDEELSWELDDELSNDPRNANPDCPAGLAAVVRKAMARDPEDRYETPTKLREDLERMNLDFAPLHARIGETTRIARNDTRAVSSVSLAPSPEVGSAPDTRPTAAMSADRQQPARNNMWPLLMIAGVVLVVGCGVGAAVLFPQEVQNILGIKQPTEAQTSTTAEAPPSIAAESRNEVTLGNQSPPSELDVPPTPPTANSNPTPTWATASGSDNFGRWAEVMVAGQSVRMRYCPAGEFTMGSADDAEGHQEQEVLHQVTISSGFWLAEHETTQALFEALMGSNPAKRTKAAHHPVEMVDWNTADRFCTTANELLGQAVFRLPTEAEWEYACRAGRSGTILATPDDSWWSMNANGSTQAVGSKLPNPWGIYDMLGNVMEWTSDAYHTFDGQHVHDPHYDHGIHRVVRGGSWTNTQNDLRAASRTKYQPTTAFFFIGFRLAISE